MDSAVMTKSPTPQGTSSESVSPQPMSAKPKKSKPKNSTTNTKTIEVGTGKNTRVAQACDRCRAKKTKCDGKQPSCSNCEAIGIKCIVSDKLSRRAFPKGYTETLEERIRQLEAENSRLGGIIDLRDEQIKGYKQDGHRSMGSEGQSSFGDNGDSFDKSMQSNGANHQLDQRNGTDNDHSRARNDIEHDHDHGESCPCGCTNDMSLVHERPVSISLADGYNGPLSITDSLNLSDDDETNSLLSTDDELISNSLGSILLQRSKLYSNRFNDGGAKPAPGAFAAATAIEKMQKDPNSRALFDKQQMLTALVAASIPRSTEETLFVPAILASICQSYGYDSKPAILAANAIGSLKENSNEVNSTDNNQEFLDVNFIRLITNRRPNSRLTSNELGSYLQYLQLPSRMELDHQITVYYKDWAGIMPILNKNSFIKSYSTFVEIYESGRVGNLQGTVFEKEQMEKFAAILVLVLALSFLSNKHELFNVGTGMHKHNTEKYIQDMKHYDNLIREFIKPSCLITSTCSITSLQILTLSLQYFLSIGDVSACFELRGRVITMAQQLRLHRCPAAVLGVSGDREDANLKNLQQGERRILFWCTYCLDVYCSLTLGVPRLWKDHEIECALPFSGKSRDDDDNENENILIVNNTKLTIVGKVSRYSLSFMLYCRVLGAILDGIYSSSQNSSGHEAVLKRERELECWRRELPDELRFEMDINGFSLKADNEMSQHLQTLSEQQLCLIFLYFHARILIYLPIISKHGNHHDVGLSAKQKLNRGESSTSVIVSSMTMIQQSSIQILEILKILFNPLNSKLLPIPINVPREHSSLTLLVAKGTLEYIKGGSLYSHSKQLLLDTIPLLSRESRYDVPGGLTKNSARLMEMAILSILGLPQNKYLLQNKKRLSTIPVTKPAVDRTPERAPSHLSGAPITNSYSQQSSNGAMSYSKQDIAITDPFASEIFGQTNLGANNKQPYGNLAHPNMNGADTSKRPEINGHNTIGASETMAEESNDFDSIFEFDPFKVNLSQNLLINEFAADGSLGLVPFLNNKDELDDFENFNDLGLENL